MRLYKMECIIKSARLEEVKDAMLRFGVSGLTVSEVQGMGAHRGHTAVYRGAVYNADLRPEIKLEVYIPEDQVDALEGIVTRVAQTGAEGDGNIIAYPIESVVHIRTGEKNCQV